MTGYKTSGASTDHTIKDDAVESSRKITQPYVYEPIPDLGTPFPVLGVSPSALSSLVYCDPDGYLHRYPLPTMKVQKAGFSFVKLHELSCVAMLEHLYKRTQYLCIEEVLVDPNNVSLSAFAHGVVYGVLVGIAYSIGFKVYRLHRSSWVKAILGHDTTMHGVDLAPALSRWLNATYRLTDHRVTDRDPLMVDHATEGWSKLQRYNAYSMAVAHFGAYYVRDRMKRTGKADASLGQHSNDA